jgi:hypothetical protein
VLLQKTPQAEIERLAGEALATYCQYGELKPHPGQLGGNLHQPHDANRQVTTVSIAMLGHESNMSQQPMLPLIRTSKPESTSAMTHVADAHVPVCVSSIQRSCGSQAAHNMVSELKPLQRADREARRLGITSQPDTPAGPGRSPGQPSAANAAACFEAIDRAVASRDAGEAANSKDAAGSQGHKYVVGSARGGGKSSFSFGAALGVKKKPAVAPAVASPALAAVNRAAGGEQVPE